MALAVLNPASPPRFTAGQVVMTIGVDALVHQGRLNPAPYLRRHISGDWGDLDESTGARTTPRCNPARNACSRPTRSRPT